MLAEEKAGIAEVIKRTPDSDREQLCDHTILKRWYQQIVVAQNYISLNITGLGSVQS